MERLIPYLTGLLEVLTPRLTSLFFYYYWCEIDFLHICFL